MSEDEPHRWEGLTVGTTYRVRWDDCCVQGAFTSELLTKVYDEDEPGWIDRIEFANGVRLSGFSFGYEIKALEAAG